MRKGFEMNIGFVVQLVLWAAVIVIVFFFIRQYIAGAAVSVPGEGLLP